ncbi:MAG: tyrosine-type recombinase/integrase [Phycisphaerae bacterium]|jgi:site-specific recombinase XerD
MPRQPWDISREMFLSVEEAASLLAHVRTQAADGQISSFLDRLIVETLLFSGVRNSEFCRLRLGDFKVGESDALLLVAGKESTRRVHLPRAVLVLLARYVNDIRPGLTPEGVRVDDPDQPLVWHERRRPFERTGLYRRVVRVLTAAGLGERASVQLLRHTYGYLAYLRTGGNLLFVQRQLGHAHPMITSIYARFVDESYADLAERVAEPFGARPEPIEPAVPKAPRERPWTSAVEEFQSEYD